MKPLKILAAAVAVMMILFGACGEAEDATSPSPSLDEIRAQAKKDFLATLTTNSPWTPTPTPEPVYTNPLTGLQTETDLSGEKPMAFMLNNIKEATPQHGIAEADIIYEMVAEGGITRLLMIKQDWRSLGIVGAVRSTRNYYIDIARGHDSILVHTGASEMAYDLLKKNPMSRVDGTNNTPDGVFYRDAERMKTRSSEHCLMTRGEMLAAYFEKISNTQSHLDGYKYPVTFKEDYKLEGGTAAGNIKVKYSSYKQTVFQYVTDDSVYAVEQFNAPHIDGNTGDQIMFTNVLVLYADISPIKGDAYDRMEADLVGSGNGFYCVGGAKVPVKWSKEAADKPFTYTDANGKEQIFRAGNTYICIVPSDKYVTVS